MPTVTITKRPLKSGKMSYVIQYVDPITEEKKHYGVTRKSADANAIKSDLNSRILLGLPIIPFSRRNKGNYFGVYAQLLMDKWKFNLDNGKMSKATYDGYVFFLAPLVALYGKRSVQSITVDEVENYRDSVASENSACLANRRLFVFKQVMKLALKDGIKSCEAVIAVKALSEKAHERNRFLLPGELDRLIAAARQTRAKHYLPLAILLGAEHGTSLQEVTSLTWSDIHFWQEGKVMMELYRSKNRNDRTHYLMPRTCEELQRWQQHVEDRRRKRSIKKVGDFVISRLDGQQMNDFDKSFRKACEIAGIDDFTYHDLRHCYCTNILLAGGTLKDAQSMIGHKTLRMTDRYAHVVGLRDTGIQERLAAHYAESE